MEHKQKPTLFNKLVKRAKYIGKQLFLTKEGIFSWLLVNLCFALPFVLPFVYGYITAQREYYLIAGSVYVFMWAMPMEIITPIVTVIVLKFLFKKDIFKKDI